MQRRMPWNEVWIDIVKQHLTEVCKSLSEYWFPRIAVTNYHKFGGQNIYKFILWQFFFFFFPPSSQTQFILELNSTIWIKESFSLHLPDVYLLIRLHADSHNPTPGLHSTDRGYTNCVIWMRSQRKLNIFPFPVLQNSS